MFHRDIKPNNILVMKDGDYYDRFVLIDFGLSKEADMEMSINFTKGAVGTLAYMDPQLKEG